MMSVGWIFDSETGEFNPKYAEIIRALPDATEEQIEAATLILDFTVRPSVYRSGKEEFLTYKPQVKREWTRSDEEA